MYNNFSRMTEEWELVKQGKVRSLYEPVNNDKLKQPLIALVAGDGVSAFDQQLGVEIPGKGKILTQMSGAWFTYFEHRYSTAFLTNYDSQLPKFFQKPEFYGRTTIMKKLNMIPVEAIMRGYITGSAWKEYQNGMREICGEVIPDGMANCDKLPRPMFTPTTKAPVGQHDENIGYTQMVGIIHDAKLGVAVSASILTQSIRDMSVGLFYDGSRYAEQYGVLLADTKFEFGIDPVNGQLTLADELFTPDSSRFWDAEFYYPGREQKSMDKQIIRDYIAGEKAAGREVTSIPQEILDQTAEAYQKCYDKLF